MNTFHSPLVLFVASVSFYVLLKKLFVRLFSFQCSGTSTVGTSPVRIGDGVMAGIVYAAATYAFFFPLFQNNHFFSHLIGPPEDNMQSYWNLWWATSATLKSFSFEAFLDHLGFTSLIYYPEGTQLYTATYSFFNMFLAFALRSFWGLAGAYNFLILLTFPLAGLGAYLLVRYVTGDHYASLLGGYVFAFNPSHTAHALYHLNIASIQFLPFFILFFIRSVRERSKKYTWAASIFFLLNALCDWYYLIYALLFMSLGYVYLGIRRRRIFMRDVMAKAITVALPTFFVLLPWLIPLGRMALEKSGASMPGHDSLVADLFAWLTPPEGHLLGSLTPVRMLNERFSGYDWEQTVYLGWVNILLVAFTFNRFIQFGAKYLMGVFVFLVLAMGNYVHVIGGTIPIMLPYRVISLIPILSHARVPSRLVVLVYLFGAILIGLSFRSLKLELGTRKMRNGILSLLALLIFFDFYSVCRAFTEVRLPPCYGKVKAEGGERISILDLPLGYTQNDHYMMYQTMHGHPIVEGLVTRRPRTALVDRLIVDDLSDQNTQLQKAGITFIVFHKKLENTALDIEAYKKQYTTYYEDEENVVFRVA